MADTTREILKNEKPVEQMAQELGLFSENDPQVKQLLTKYVAANQFAYVHYTQVGTDLHKSLAEVAKMSDAQLNLQVGSEQAYLRSSGQSANDRTNLLLGEAAEMLDAARTSDLKPENRESISLKNYTKEFYSKANTKDPKVKEQIQVNYTRVKKDLAMSAEADSESQAKSDTARKLYALAIPSSAEITKALITPEQKIALATAQQAESLLDKAEKIESMHSQGSVTESMRAKAQHDWLELSQSEPKKFSDAYQQTLSVMNRNASMLEALVIMNPAKANDPAIKEAVTSLKKLGVDGYHQAADQLGHPAAEKLRAAAGAIAANGKPIERPNSAEFAEAVQVIDNGYRTMSYDKNSVEVPLNGNSAQFSLGTVKSPDGKTDYTTNLNLTLNQTNQITGATISLLDKDNKIAIGDDGKPLTSPLSKDEVTNIAGLATVANGSVVFSAQTDLHKAANFVLDSHQKPAPAVDPKKQDAASASANKPENNKPPTTTPPEGTPPVNTTTPPDAPKGFSAENNKSGILAGVLGALLLGIFSGNMILALLGGIIAFAVGSFMGDENGFAKDFIAKNSPGKKPDPNANAAGTAPNKDKNQNVSASPAVDTPPVTQPKPASAPAVSSSTIASTDTSDSQTDLKKGPSLIKAQNGNDLTITLQGIAENGAVITETVEGSIGGGKEFKVTREKISDGKYTMVDDNKSVALKNGAIDTDNMKAAFTAQISDPNFADSLKQKGVPNPGATPDLAPNTDISYSGTVRENGSMFPLGVMSLIKNFGVPGENGKPALAITGSDFAAVGNNVAIATPELTLGSGVLRHADAGMDLKVQLQQSLPNRGGNVTQLS